MLDVDLILRAMERTLRAVSGTPLCENLRLLPATPPHPAPSQQTNVRSIRIREGGEAFIMDPDTVTFSRY